MASFSLVPSLLALLLLMLRTTASDGSAHHNNDASEINETDPSLSIFFKIEQLKSGTRLPIYFSNRQLHLLSRQQANSIPFSSSHLPSLLQLFSFSQHSHHAKAVHNTLSLCELHPMTGETKFCATSLESMLDSVRAYFGTNTQFKALTTTATSLQNYTILKEPEQILASKVMSCHTMPYPYLVYYCHSPAGGTKLFRVMLGGQADREIVEAVALCHMDTSKWDRDNPSFRVLNIEPGKGPVCHFFPRYDIAWAALPE